MATHDRSARLAALRAGNARELGAPEQVDRARRLLESNDVAIAGDVPDALLELVVFDAAERRRAEFFAAAIEGPKALAKLAKKELYRLKSEGRALELPVRPRESAKPVAKEAELPAFLSPVDVDGRRTFVAPHAGSREFEALLGEISDQLGVVRVDAAPMPRREYRKFARELSRPPDGAPPWLEVTAAELGAQLAAARAISERRADVPRGMEHLARIFPGEPAPARSRSRPRLDEARERELVQHGAELFAELENARWVPDEHALATLAQRLDEVATSRLVVDEGQRRAQLEAAMDRVVDEYFTRERRALWAERLFRQADHFAGTGRQAQAERCAANARALESDAAIAEVPLCRALFQKAMIEQMHAALARMPPEVRARIEREQQERAQKAEPSSPLIVPGK